MYIFWHTLSARGAFQKATLKYRFEDIYSLSLAPVKKKTH